MRLKQMINFINILKIGYKTRTKVVKIPFFQVSFSMLHFLFEKGLITSWKLEGSRVHVSLHFVKNRPIFHDIKFVSTGGYRRYIEKNKNIKYYKDNIEIILWTGKGLLSFKKAEELGIGGEVFMIIFY